MRCIESATKLFGGRVGATIGDVLVAADKFETFVVVGNRQTLRPDQWDCRCGYQNTGPICTKCGQLRQGQRR